MSKKRLTLEDACTIARNRGRQCLSTQYTTNKDLLLWYCPNNHEWYTSLGHVKYSKSWCSHCVKVARCTIEDIKQIAFARNRECLLTEYINSKTILLWCCSNYHEYGACLYCANRVSHTIEDARQIAISRNRKCLSTEYINSYLYLLWCCSKGHEFLAKYPTGLELNIPYYDYSFVIEVQDIQHERQIKFFYPNFEDFKKQQTQDQLKKEL
ncbi:4715_t:CDS:2, partial [Racocetra persica]